MPKNTCDKCEAPTTWATIEARNGRPAHRIPLDAEPGDGRAPRAAYGEHANVVLTGGHDADGTPLARHVKPGAGEHSCHWATCPARTGAAAAEREAAR